MSLSATVAFIVLLTKAYLTRHNDWNPEKLKLGLSFNIVLKKQVLTIEHSIREEVDPVPQDKYSRRSTQHQVKFDMAMTVNKEVNIRMTFQVFLGISTRNSLFSPI